MNRNTLHVSVLSGRIECLIDELEDCVAATEPISFHAMPLASDGMPEPPAQALLLIDLPSLPAETVRRLEPLLSSRPFLGLLAEEGGDAGHQLLPACGETLAWPRQREELDACLHRLHERLHARLPLEQMLTLRLNLIGESPVFLDVLREVRRFSCCDAPVMVLGETGTGKEKIARAIHYLGVAEGEPFVAVNCGALPDSLVENELFGHVRGAYTDAREAQKGLVEQAAGGSLFLDEIEALSPKGQVALLRFLQEYEYRPIGSDRTRTARLRLITASNEPLEELVREGRFRKDLYYRINILNLTLPPLRERGDDVLLLAEHFLEQFRNRYGQHDRQLSAATREWLPRAHWSGNVRELENLLLRAFLLAETTEIHIDPPADLRRERRHRAIDRRMNHLFEHSFKEAKGLVISAFERSYLEQMLRETRGNISQAARRAGKERRSFAKLLEKHGLDKQRFFAD